MKKIVFSLLSLSVVMSANAWETPGKNVPTGINQYKCDPYNSYCMKSVDPSDPNKSVGDKVITKIGDKEFKGTITGIETTINSAKATIDSELGFPIEIVVSEFSMSE